MAAPAARPPPPLLFTHSRLKRFAAGISRDRMRGPTAVQHIRGLAQGCPLYRRGSPPPVSMQGRLAEPLLSLQPGLNACLPFYCDPPRPPPLALLLLSTGHCAKLPTCFPPVSTCFPLCFFIWVRCRDHSSSPVHVRNAISATEVQSNELPRHTGCLLARAGCVLVSAVILIGADRANRGLRVAQLG